MKGLAFLSTGIALVALILFFFQQSQISELKKSLGNPDNSKKHVAQADESVENESEIEVVHYMTRIQTFHAKLYFSGINNNNELIKFYLHELEEEMEAIADANIMDEGINISQNMELFGVKQIEWFEKELENKSDFKTTFQSFTSSSCNGCHQASKHDYIQIKVPDQNPFFNQVFEKK